MLEIGIDVVIEYALSRTRSFLHVATDRIEAGLGIRLDTFNVQATSTQPNPPTECRQHLSLALGNLNRLWAAQVRIMLLENHAA